MRFLIIGSGIVGLSIAKVLIDRKIFAPSEILIIDKYSIPSKGASVRNSGVLHAGLYYKPGSLKAKLSIDGGYKLKNWCKNNKLQILECGKLLIPFNPEDIKNLNKIEKNANDNGCKVEIIDYKDAVNIQPGIVKQEKYLWSPKTCVFSPSVIVKRLYELLKEMGVGFLKKGVKKDDFEKKQIIFQDNSKINYFKYINCAGPGALQIAKSVTDEFNELTILPFLGQYVVQKTGLDVKTNLYPVPDPELPFLGIHLTPRISSSTLIGPNAFPVINKDIQGFDIDELRDIPSIIFNNLVLFASNKSNYRNHAFSEFSLRLKEKFYKNSVRFFTKESSENFSIELDTKTYGIRSQLINRKSYEFMNDFKYKNINNNMHIINAVSPAFTSAFALAEFILDRMDL